MQRLTLMLFFYQKISVKYQKWFIKKDIKTRKIVSFKTKKHWCKKHKSNPDVNVKNVLQE